jgi:hypothetical protein
MNDLDVVALVGGLSVVANLIVLGLNLKLYTEFFKESAQRGRSQP